MSRNQLVERLAGNKLHRNKVDALGFADVVDRDDVGVGDLGRQERLVREALRELRRVRVGRDGGARAWLRANILRVLARTGELMIFGQSRAKRDV